jgi:hypothetical protein
MKKEVAVLGQTDKHNNSLVNRYKDIEVWVGGMPTINTQKLATILSDMPMIDRAIQTTGRKNTQTTSQLMSLTMMCDSPYRRLRQCLAQIDTKRNALNSAYFTHKKALVNIAKWKDKGDAMSLVKIEEAESQLTASRNTIEGALKEIGMYQEAYKEIMETNNIPADWDEVDVEKEEIAHHIRMAFRNCHKDLIQNGCMNMGTMEYLEQYGIHPMTARAFVMKYVDDCDKLIQNSNGKQMPSVTSLYDFLDRMVDEFKDAHKEVMKRIGIKTLMKEEYLFMDKQSG